MKRGHLSLSYLIQKTAEELTAEILDPEDEDGHTNLWSFIGNGMADRSLQDFPHQEAEVVYDDLPGAWAIVGHPDAFHATDRHVHAIEHKAHFSGVTTLKIELAKRQDALCLAIAWYQHRATGEGVPTTFPVADYANDEEGIEPFTWAPGLRPGGVLVKVVKMPPFIYELEVFTEDELDQLLEYYVEKANVVVRAVEMQDPEYARTSWDEQAGEGEFGPPVPVEDEDELERVLEELDAAREQKRRLEKEVIPELDEVAEQFMRSIGADEVRVGDFDAKIVENSGRRYAKVSDEEARGRTDPGGSLWPVTGGACPREGGR